jgi:hypothetical protein
VHEFCMNRLTTSVLAALRDQAEESYWEEHRRVNGNFEDPAFNGLSVTCNIRVLHTGIASITVRGGTLKTSL